MRKRRTKIIKMPHPFRFSALIIAFMMIIPAGLRAEDGSALMQIQQELKEIKQGQEKIMETLAQLSEEHKQIKIWVHKK